MPENSESSEKRQRISVQTNEGLLTEEELSLLLDLEIPTVVKYIKEGKIPGYRITSSRTKVRTLTSVRQLIELVEKKSGTSET